MQFPGFFQAQAELSVGQWALRGLVAYLFLLSTARLLGQRSIAQLTLLDFVTALILGNILAHPLSDEKLGLLGPLTTTLVLVLLHVAASLLTRKWEPGRRFFEPPPLTLIRNGQISQRGLARAKLTLDSLLSELRKHQVDDLRKVALALLEPEGRISVFLQPQFSPATPSDLQLQVKPFALPTVVIKEGTIDLQTLREMGKDESWLRSRLGGAPGDVLLATLGPGDALHVVKYELSPRGRR